MGEKEPVITVMTTDDTITINKNANLNVEILNGALLTLPARTYLDLFYEMRNSIYGSFPFVNYGGCCGSLEGNVEDNAKYYDERPVKKTESYAVFRGKVGE